MTRSNRLWVIGSVTVMIIMLVAGWFIGAEPNITAAASDDTARAGIEAQNAAKQGDIARLTEESKDLDSIEKEYAALQKSIPASTDPAAFISGLDGLAASTGVQVTGISVGDPQAYTVPQSAVQVPTDTSTDAPDDTVAPVTPTGYVAATSPLITPENFVGIKVGVDLKGSYQSVLAFVKGLQSGARLVLITGFTSTANAGGIDGSGDVTSHVDGLIYVLKQPS